MQEQSRLQQPGRDIAPVDRPVKLIQFSRELESVKDKRDQAKDIEMRGTGRRPASQQYIKPDAQIDQGDESKPIVERVLSRNQDYAHIQRDRLPKQRVICFRPR